MPSKVLIVDDEPNIVISLQFLMRKAGFETSVARDGDEALREVDAFGPDRVFWGSDWTRLPCSYVDGLAYLAEALPHLDDGCLRRITGGAVLDALGWAP